MSRQQISIAASQVLQFVETGGWLGASWPVYAIKAKTLRRVRPYLLAVYRLANDRCWRWHGQPLRALSDINFRESA